jgi:Fe-S-cluster containining protein
VSDPWFREGLRFQCRRCGACCTGEPGYVYLRRGEAGAIAAFAGLGVKEFRARYTRKDHGRTSLGEESDGRCVFFEEGECRIYQVRPVQCRTFPFWRWNTASRENWKTMAGECPGLGKGKLFSLEEIRSLLAKKIG